MGRKGYRISLMAAVLIFGTCSIVAAMSPAEPWTAKKLLERCDMLVFGRVERAEVLELHGRPVTEYRFEAREVHLDKQGRPAGVKAIRILVPGGAYTDREGKKRRWRPLSAPELESQADYILFLKWWQEQEGYVVVGGEAGAFKVDEDGRVLDLDGNAILDVLEEGFVAVPGKARRTAREQQRPDAPPAGIVEDLSGTRRTVKAGSGSAFDGAYDETRVLKMDAFIRKVLGGRP
jgi:hypothetical protein